MVLGWLFLHMLRNAANLILHSKKKKIIIVIENSNLSKQFEGIKSKLIRAAQTFAALVAIVGVARRAIGTFVAALRIDTLA